MLAVLLASLALAAEPADWQKAESVHLHNIKQVTSDFVRAGEGYFSPDGKTIIFQAEEKDTGNPFYQIFTTGPGGRPRPPRQPRRRQDDVQFLPARRQENHLRQLATSIPTPKSITPRNINGAGTTPRPAATAVTNGTSTRYMTIFEANPDGADLKPLTHAKGYNAEGSYSPDGKQIVFTSNRGAADSLEIYIMDADGKNVRQVTHAPHCYNGGPFFSPDGKRIIFRSDRKEKDRLQLYVINAGRHRREAR